MDFERIWVFPTIMLLLCVSFIVWLFAVVVPNQIERDARFVSRCESAGGMPITALKRGNNSPYDLCMAKGAVLEVGDE